MLLTGRVFCLFLSSLLWAGCVSSDAQAFEARSSSGRTSLLELFSSEGCSSCPPADEWMRSFRGDPGLWKDIVPVTFHVDYWDSLGWKDRFARPEFTARQRRYSAEWKSGSIYTPGFVLNGREWRDWGSRPPKISGESVGILSIRSLADDKYEVVFNPEKTGREAMKAHVAVLGFDLRSEVTRGENAGRTLIHDFVVLGYAEEALRQDKDGTSHAIVKVGSPSADPAKAIAAWVTGEKSSEPLQATGDFL